MLNRSASARRSWSGQSAGACAVHMRSLCCKSRRGASTSTIGREASRASRDRWRGSVTTISIVPALAVRSRQIAGGIVSGAFRMIAASASTASRNNVATAASSGRSAPETLMALWRERWAKTAAMSRRPVPGSPAIARRAVSASVPLATASATWSSAGGMSSGRARSANRHAGSSATGKGGARSNPRRSGQRSAGTVTARVESGPSPSSLASTNRCSAPPVPMRPAISVGSPPRSATIPSVGRGRPM